MSTLADLFNIRIGASRRAVFVERRGNSLKILLSPEKLPLKEVMAVKTYAGMSLVDALSEENVVKENVYYILSPRSYYKNRVALPFQDRQKIEGILKYEVKDSLPFTDTDFLTDFYQAGGDILSFTVEKDIVRGILEELGEYSENLKAIVPYDMALYYGMTALVDDETYVLLDIAPDAVYLQWVQGLKIRAGVMVGEVPDSAAGIKSSSSHKDFRARLLQEFLMVFKISRCKIAYINVEAGCEQTQRVAEELLDKMGIDYNNVPHERYESYLGRNISFDPGGVLPLFGVLQGINKPPARRVNLLKEEFKPRLKGYVSVKEFTIAGMLLLLLLVLSTVSLAVDIGFRRNQVTLLREKSAELGQSVFGERFVEDRKAREFVTDFQGKLKAIEENTDLRFSAIMLLRELVLSLPKDVVIEYSDIVIEREHIKFFGKTRTFSDIDRIRQGLMGSDYFKNVKVSNTGTTGSTQGFTVTFVFDIDVVRR